MPIVKEAHVQQHAVIAHFDYAADSLDALYDVEEELEAAINFAEVGNSMETRSPSI